MSKSGEMTKERQGEIALKMIVAKAKAVEIPSPNTFKRELGNYAKEVGIETEEMISFYEAAILPEVLGTMLGRVGATVTSK